MISFLTFTEVTISIFIVFLSIFNKSNSMGLGVYTDNIGIGFNSFLFKFTLFLIFLFVGNSIALGYLFSTLNNGSVV